ncbi:MAG TPA: SprT family zinc-dependent metalloprotease [Verrucomicrobiota bacterium]|nr:SprT family zinc-dependent metalloprotease [Verrucomicrobiota bacterium]HRT10066.1 SprT family zinc-dependent metalloprotease [Candidatus Paceibacterota bacterium]
MDLVLGRIGPPTAFRPWVQVGEHTLPLRLVRNARARRYILRLSREGLPQVTIPRGGSAAEATAFAQRQAHWIASQLHKHAQRPAQPRPWQIGSAVRFRGELTRIQPADDGTPNTVRLGSELIPVRDLTADLRLEIQGHLRRLASLELPRRTLELAAAHGFAVRRVTVRNQRSRWGSCSRRGTLSLNWRLVQAPPAVRDYIILHELAHTREMNHSVRFWRLVGTLCPHYQEAERWIKQHSRELL